MFRCVLMILCFAGMVVTATDSNPPNQLKPMTSVVDGIRWIPHVTSSNGGFQTRVILTNTSDVDSQATLRVYTVTGNFSDVTLNVAAHNHSVWTPDELWFEEEVSHFQINSDPGIIASASFRVTLDKVGGTAHVKETGDMGQRFILFPGEWDTVWDGMALVNLGDGPADVTATALDETGEMIGRVILAEGLEPHHKVLAVLSSVFQDSPGARIEIRSSQTSVVTFLRGSAVDGPSYLYQTRPIMAE